MNVNISGSNVQIMWKEIAIILIILYLIRCLTDLYIIKEYKKILNSFFADEWRGLEQKIEKHQKLCNIFSNGPFNKKIRFIYNTLCVVLASIKYIDGNEPEFLYHLKRIKKENEFEMKSFVLALYFHSKGRMSEAEESYHYFLKCNSENQEAKDILVYLFYPDQRKDLEVACVKAKQAFRNPAIIELFKVNHI